MLKGKLFDEKGNVRFEGEMSASDYLLLYGNQENQTPLPTNTTLLPSAEMKLPSAPEIKLVLDKLPKTQRTMANISQHFFGRILPAKNRRVYGVVYARFVRASRKLEREEKSG